MALPDRLVGWLTPYLAGRPVTHGLAEGLRGLILDGRLLPEVRLPSERALAEALGLSRATVTSAFDVLRGEGLLRSRPADGTRIVLPSHRPYADPDGVARRGDAIDLTAAVLPAGDAVDEAMRHAAFQLSPFLTGAGVHPSGLDELRAVIADRYTRRGLPTTGEQVLITSGALHGWNLLLGVVASPGAHILVEQPTYPSVVDAVLAHRLRPLPLPVDEDGWDVSQLSSNRAALAHLTFDGHNPTGRWASDAERGAVLAALPRSTLVVCDETLVDFPHQAVTGTPTAALTGRTVVTLGSMSKTFWPGLRVGWIRGPVGLVSRIAAVRTGVDLGPAVVGQLAARHLLDRADQLLPARRRVVAARRSALLEALDTADWPHQRPGGGLSVWVDLGGISSTDLARLAPEHGVRVTPGPRFTVTGTHDRHLRLPFVLPPATLADAVRRLSEAATRAGRARRPSRQAPYSSWVV
ncbi:PLP-dependent aminotransferase family protein [Streptomyces malaysiensis subsp. malaysiensis]|uniref:PLP-dependent aminotransferase family protein n=1 Tax=Streptomyces malaysiensis TaxID=92644 RepID=A0ABX6WIV9_STRMQ|nr:MULTISPECIES: PLP-dependent aminotransferase family protein [Streptomyces]QPI61312.1 PLP-dependent aminotransferase family protein [Streptomyces solisilvae]UHH23080.1 PLP-dependent aminotransferase family protein [Streptomyces sp. HNM0561]